ncbi:LOW QUALITY PROTEIN: hypothetical protein OSB04_005874 [Centaurea solstitialis]|uniref:Uncharacterized protein n=1 Tax=Centaurea solstitialis TaxID=347529 RepID=A0AA38TGV8_9ASTR|nr:LOW QUALITY PROTEIN: hypothetical protein OSB04_005874 [Centaurea solstitialis]
MILLRVCLFSTKFPSSEIKGSKWVECRNHYKASKSCFTRLRHGHCEQLHLHHRLCPLPQGGTKGHDLNDMKEVDLEVYRFVLQYNIRDNKWSKCSPHKIPHLILNIYVVKGKCTIYSVKGLLSSEVTTCNCISVLVSLGKVEFMWLIQRRIVHTKIEASKLPKLLNELMTSLPPFTSIAMGSLPSSSQLPRRQDEDSPQFYRVYASFSAKFPSSDVKRSNWIECYNPSNNTWNQVTTIPGIVENHFLKGFAMVIVGDFIYIIGGVLCHKEVVEGHDLDDVSEINLEVYQSVLRYNIIDDTWSKCAPLKVPRFDFACTVSGNNIYVAGGKCTTKCVRGVSSSEVYDPALDQWKSLPDMSTSRYKCVSVTWQGRIYVVGGFAESGSIDTQGPFTMARSSAEVYDTVNNKWDFLPRMWDLDVPPNQIVVAGDKLFSSGDIYKKWKGFIEKYDRELNMWNVVDGSSPTSMLDVTSPQYPPMEQLYLTIAPIGAYLYFLAGYRMADETSTRFRSEVHVFDVRSEGEWTSHEPIVEDAEKELCCHCAIYKRRY